MRHITFGVHDSPGLQAVIVYINPAEKVAKLPKTLWILLAMPKVVFANI